jgi:hypothetical protein
MLLVYVDGRGLVLKRKRRRWLRGLRGLRRASAALLRVDVVVVDLAPSSFVNQSIGEGPARPDQKGPWLEAARGAGRQTARGLRSASVGRPAGATSLLPRPSRILTTILLLLLLLPQLLQQARPAAYKRPGGEKVARS